MERDLADAGDFLRNSARHWSVYDCFTQWNFNNRRIEAGTLYLSYYDLLDTIY
jgi:hypothetical protein